MKNEISNALNNSTGKYITLVHNNRTYEIISSIYVIKLTTENQELMEVNLFTNKVEINCESILDAGFAAIVLDVIFN